MMFVASSNIEQFTFSSYVYTEASRNVSETEWFNRLIISNSYEHKAFVICIWLNLIDQVKKLLSLVFNDLTVYI